MHKDAFFRKKAGIRDQHGTVSPFLTGQRYTSLRSLITQDESSPEPELNQVRNITTECVVYAPTMHCLVKLQNAVSASLACKVVLTAVLHATPPDTTTDLRVCISAAEAADCYLHTLWGCNPRPTEHAIRWVLA